MNHVRIVGHVITRDWRSRHMTKSSESLALASEISAENRIIFFKLQLVLTATAHSFMNGTLVIAFVSNTTFQFSCQSLFWACQTSACGS